MNNMSVKLSDMAFSCEEIKVTLGCMNPSCTDATDVDLRAIVDGMSMNCPSCTQEMKCHFVGIDTELVDAELSWKEQS